MEEGHTQGEFPGRPGMRILLDGGPLTVATGGIRRYVEELSVALASQAPGDEIHVAADRPIGGGERIVRAGVHVHAEFREGWERRWWLFGLPRLCNQLNAAVFHGTDFAVPLRHRVPAVVTIHDLSPWIHPEWQPAAQRIRRRLPWMLRLGFADQVITVSKAMRREILGTFRISSDRVHAIPLAADERFRPVTPPARPEPYFLFVGTLEPRKNLWALVEAWRPVFSATGIPLKIAGRRREDFTPPPLEPGLEYSGAIPDEALPALYSGALAVVYPSGYEGFGLPVLEAMQCGAPVIVGKAPALSELVADDGIVVDAERGDSLQAALRRIAGDAAFQREWAMRGLRRAGAFTWQKTARATREVYREAVKRFEHTA
ncbi:MAG: glycosyltransferase family 4 protein [Bryobacterales bacterium]|nr:glycosyltransferase family 4 protein [Bryobacterales bacterium]